MACITTASETLRTLTVMHADDWLCSTGGHLGFRKTRRSEPTKQSQKRVNHFLPRVFAADTFERKAHRDAPTVTPSYQQSSANHSSKPTPQEQQRDGDGSNLGQGSTPSAFGSTSFMIHGWKTAHRQLDNQSGKPPNNALQQTPRTR